MGSPPDLKQANRAAQERLLPQGIRVVPKHEHCPHELPLPRSQEGNLPGGLPAFVVAIASCCGCPSWLHVYLGPEPPSNLGEHGPNVVYRKVDLTPQQPGSGLVLATDIPRDIPHPAGVRP